MEGTSSKDFWAQMTEETAPHPHNIRKQIIISAIAAVLVLTPLLWALLDRTPPYTFTHVEIMPNEVEQGGTIYIHFTVKQNRQSCGPGLVYREFKEGTTGKLHVFDPVLRAVAPEIDNQGQYTRIAKLPENLTPGVVFYRGRACYTCNPIHSWLRWPVCVSTTDAPTGDVPFTVLRREGEKPKETR